MNVFTCLSPKGGKISVSSCTTEEDGGEDSCQIQQINSVVVEESNNTTITTAITTQPSGTSTAYEAKYSHNSMMTGDGVALTTKSTDTTLMSVTTYVDAADPISSMLPLKDTQKGPRSTATSVDVNHETQQQKASATTKMVSVTTYADAADPVPSSRSCISAAVLNVTSDVALSSSAKQKSTGRKTIPDSTTTKVEGVGEIIALSDKKQQKLSSTTIITKEPHVFTHGVVADSSKEKQQEIPSANTTIPTYADAADPSMTTIGGNCEEQKSTFLPTTRADTVEQQTVRTKSTTTRPSNKTARSSKPATKGTISAVEDDVTTVVLACANEGKQQRPKMSSSTKSTTPTTATASPLPTPTTITVPTTAKIHNTNKFD